MAPLRSPLFIVCLILFITHQVLQKGLHIQLGLADRYLDNLTAMPVILTLYQAEKIWLFKKAKTFRLSLPEIVIATFYIILITEILFPFLSKNFTGDWIDILFYCTGTLLFYLYDKRNNRPDNKKVRYDNSMLSF